MTHPIVSVYPDRVIYRASAVGGCLRSLYAARLEYNRKSIPDKFQSIFQRGHEIENITKSILHQKGWTITSTQEEVSLELGECNGKKIIIVGHIDFFSAASSFDDVLTTNILTEVKGFGKDLLSKYLSHGITFESFPSYAYQISIYAHALKTFNYRYIIYDKTRTDLSEDHPDRLIISTHNHPPISFTQIYNRVMSIEDSISTRSMPACTNSYPCQYYYLHDEKETSLITTVTERLAIAYKSIDNKIKELESAKSKIKDKILSALTTDESITHYSNAIDTVSITLVNNPDRLNQKAAKAILSEAGVPESEYITRGSGYYPRITVKGTKDNK